MAVSITKEKVELLLREKGMTKAEFAAKMGVKRQNIDALLSSQKKDINVVLKMAEVLNIPFDEFSGIQKRGKPQPHGIIKYQGHFYDINSKQDLINLLAVIK